MKGFLCITKAANNEEYRNILKKRNIIFIITAIIGIAMAVVSELAFLNGLAEMSEKSLGFITGAGTGLAGGSIGMIIKNVMLMKNEQKLKAQRIANSDERVAAIVGKAQSTSLTVLVLALGGGCLIGGIFYPILIDVFSAAVFIWAVSYLISYFIYSRKM